MAVTEKFVTRRVLPDALELPPGPKMPALAQTVLFMGARRIFAPRWQRKYGDVFSIHVLPAGHAVVISTPEHIREVFAGAPDVFHAGEGNAILGPIMGRHSVLLLDETEHLAARKRVMAAFHGEAIANWGTVVTELAEQQVAGWPSDRPFAVHPHMNDISLEVILRIVFGMTDESRLAQMRPLLQRLVRIGPVIFMGWFYPALEKLGGPWKRFDEIKRRTDELIYREIADRRAVSDLAARSDVLSKLLVADPQQSDQELRDHLVTLLLAGHETTASTLAWTFHDLSRRPELMARVQRAADADDDDYLEAVVKESMRLRPVIGEVARRLNKPATVAGYDLPAGVVIFPSIELVQRRATVYDAPEQFRPERFLGSNPPPATWIPFGGGIRRCLGAALAMVEAKAVLKVVAQRVDLAPVGREEWPRARNVTTIPARGARITVRPRLSRDQ
jgi:cytochrome P450 family 135